MKEQFVPYELALKLKQLGFNEVCLANYNNLTDNTRLLLGKTDEGCITWNKTPDKYNAIIESNERILAPLWQQAFDWFRNEHGYMFHIDWSWINREKETIFWDFAISYDLKRYLSGNGYYMLESKGINQYSTYEEARLKCLEKLIELVETKKDSV